MTFDPIDYGFSWVADGTELGWYTYTGKTAEQQARKARDQYVREQRKHGRRVAVGTHGRQLRTMGGIGSGHPEISLIVPIYYANVQE